MLDFSPTALRSAPALRETWSKGFDNAADTITELNRRFKQRLTLHNPRFVDHYLEFELHFLIRFRIGGIDKEFIAHLEREKVVSRSNEKIGNYFSGKCAARKSLENSPNADTAKARTYRDNQAVLVDVVQAVEGPEAGPLPSVVWFESADRVNSVLPHALYFSGKSGFELFGTTRNQETRIVTIARSVPGSDQIQLLSKVIECASQAVEDVTSDSRKTSRDGCDALNIINQLSRLRIALGSNFIGIGIEKGAECRLEVVDMFVGPFNFQSN
jgi:hypothetical protein